MADDIYIVDQLATGIETVTITDDGSGLDWIIFQGSYAVATDINLNWTYTGAASDGTATSGEGFYFYPSNTGHRLIVNGLIENARGSNGADFIQGNSAANILYGDNAATGAGLSDTLSGGYGNDTLYGGSGGDTVGGGQGADLLYGDAGADTMSGGEGADTLIGGEGADSISGGADGSDWVSYLTSAARVDVRLIAGATSTSFGGDAEGDRINGVNHVIGSNFNDKITDRPESNAYNANRFDGMDGADSLTMGGGNDTAYGGNGSDSIFGQTGDDLLYGGEGRDKLFGGEGRDVIYGNGDHNYIDGGAGADTVRGGDLRDVLYGGSDGDLIYGNGGGDSFFGGGGNDDLRGGAGDDMLNSGAGRDQLFGGAGADDFRFISRTDSGASIETRDMIMDFSHAQGDKIHLGQLTLGVGDLIYRGTAGFTGTAGEVRLSIGSQHTLVLADLDGDRTADFSIQVRGITDLVRGDFIL